MLELHGWGSDDLKPRLEAKDLSYLRTLGPRSRNDVEWLRFDMAQCRSCKETAALTVKRVDLTRQEGRELPRPIVDNLLVTQSEVEQLRKYQF